MGKILFQGILLVVAILNSQHYNNKNNIPTLAYNF